MLILFGAIICLTGCTNLRNGYSEFYQDRAGTAITNLPPYSGETRIVTATSTNDIRDLLRDNYGLIGYAGFQGPAQSQDKLMYQAKRVGADIVCLSCTYLGSQQSAVPIIQYQAGQTYNTTTYGTFNANAYGSGGYAYGNGNYYGNSTTTSPGTFNTQMVPVTIQRFQYEAGFFRKCKTPILGTVPTELPPDLRQRLQRNTGVYVSLVKNDTPAFYANILEGDVILTINGQDVESVKDLLDKLLLLAGQKVDNGIWRDGEIKNITAQLNAKP
jgi:serine protease Do